ncbi:MAG: hypothetical protein SGCHY_001012 [Lobulomycetales sp.]
MQTLGRKRELQENTNETHYNLVTRPEKRVATKRSVLGSSSVVCMSRPSDMQNRPLKQQSLNGKPQLPDKITAPVKSTAALAANARSMVRKKHATATRRAPSSRNTTAYNGTTLYNGPTLLVPKEQQGVVSAAAKAPVITDRTIGVMNRLSAPVRYSSARNENDMGLNDMVLDRAMSDLPAVRPHLSTAYARTTDPIPVQQLSRYKAMRYSSGQDRSSLSRHLVKRFENPNTEYINDVHSHFSAMTPMDTMPSPLAASIRHPLTSFQSFICTAFSFTNTTLFTSINLLDRFLHSSRVAIDPSRLHLAAISCVWIAAKTEEVKDIPPVANLLSLATKDTYSVKEMIRSERYILTCVGWKTRSSVMFWIDWTIHQAQDSEKLPPTLRILIEYLATCGLCSAETCTTRPDHLVSACSLLAREMLGLGATQTASAPQSVIRIGQRVLAGLVKGRQDYAGAWERYAQGGTGASCYVEQFLRNLGHE